MLKRAGLFCHMQTLAHSEAAIEQSQRRRGYWLLLAHLPAMIFLLMGAFWLALMILVLLHLALLWGTLNPQSALFGPVLRRVSLSAQAVWLTIDDGPSADTPAILELLARHQAKATFFLVAERAQRHPELVRAMVAAGHGIGNHSHSHPAGWFWCLSPARLRQEIITAQRMLTEIATQPVPWFRAVVGHANPFLSPVLSGLGLRRVAWSARAYDAVDGNVNRVVSKLLAKLEPGVIMLLHEGAAHGHSVAIIEKFLQQLETRGYRALLPTAANARGDN